MAEYHYDPYRSPYVGSIADLMGRGGDIQAQAALRAGDIRANAATNTANIQANQMMQSGANWGNALNQVGQTIAAIPAEMQQQKFRSAQLANIQAESDRRAAEAAAMQRDQRAQTLWSQALKSSVGDDGVVDHQKAADMLSKAGYPVQANAYLEAAQKTQITAQQITEGQRKIKEGQDLLQKASINHLGELAAVGLSKLDKSTPLEARDTITGLVANAASHGLISEDDARQFLMRSAQAGPDQLRNLYQGLLDSAPEVKDKLLKGRLTESEIAKNEAAANRPPATKALQSKSMLLDGKPAEVLFDPESGGYTFNGQKVDATRVKPIPPASVTIRNMNAQPINLPAWATDDSRPTGTDANKVDPISKMTPSGLFQAAQNYIATGQYPQTGRGSDPQSQATRAAINAKVGAVAAASGMDEAALRAFYKSNAASLTQQQKNYDSVQGFMATADKNAALLERTLDKIPDSGTPLLNGPLRQFAKSVLGDPNMSQAATYLQSVQNEYARIIAQPNLAGQLTDSARHEAQQLIDPNATVAQMIASIRALNAEGNNRLISGGEQIQRIQQRLMNPSNATNPAGIQERWERGPDGKLRKVGG